MMFCSKCGTKNEDTAAFCAGCGSGLQTPPIQQPYYAAPEQPVAPYYTAPQQPTAPEQPGYYQQPYDPGQSYYHPHTPSAPAKKKPWAIIAVAVAAVAVVVILLVFLLGGGSGYSDPEDAALAYAEGHWTGDWDLCESAMHPDLIDPEMEEKFEEAVAEDIERRGLDAKNFNVDRVEDYDEGELEYAAKKIERKYDLKVTDAKNVRVTLDVYSDLLGRWNEGLRFPVVVVEIDGEWYAVPGM